MLVEREMLLEIEQFLYHEAWLLEQRMFNEWLDLVTDDVRYSMPNRSTGSPRGEQASLADDDLPALRMKVARMYDPLNPALQPAARTKYFVTNVAVVERAEDLSVRSSVLLYVVRENGVRHHPISCEYRLRAVDGGWKIAFKQVSLVENGRPLSLLPLI
jgi:3-phenylpropionate/cinnamic acid dioxygenase small subunit